MAPQGLGPNLDAPTPQVTELFAEYWIGEFAGVEGLRLIVVFDTNLLNGGVLSKLCVNCKTVLGDESIVGWRLTDLGLEFVE